MTVGCQQKIMSYHNVSLPGDRSPGAPLASNGQYLLGPNGIQVRASSVFMSRDQIYALPLNRVGDFAFDDSVAEVFPDMIARSVPGYASILSMIQQLARRFVRPQTQVYDLGCSLGAATFLIQEVVPASVTIHAIDNSEAMIRRLQPKVTDSDNDSNRKRARIEIHLADINQFPIKQASLVVLNLTLQFIPAAERRALLQTVYDGLLPGAALLLSEKLSFDDTNQQSLLTELHHEFKKSHGYSDLEIAQKRTAIENRLIPETLESHRRRLQDVGFETVALWFQCFNFASILAVKSDIAEPERSSREN